MLLREPFEEAEVQDKPREFERVGEGELVSVSEPEQRELGEEIEITEEAGNGEAAGEEDVSRTGDGEGESGEDGGDERAGEEDVDADSCEVSIELVSEDAGDESEEQGEIV